MGRALVQHALTIEVDATTTPGTPDWTEVKGILDFDESLNDVVNDYQYIDKNGFGESEHTGMHPMYTLTGNRIPGDAGQDFIFAKKYDIGDDRKFDFRVTYAASSSTTRTIMVNVTLGALQEFSGGATDNSAISIELRANAEPSDATA